MAVGCKVRACVSDSWVIGLVLVGNLFFSRHRDVDHTWDWEWCALLLQACEAGLCVATSSVTLPAMFAASAGLASAWILTLLTTLL